VVSTRRDEIGRAEAELDRMQTDLLAALASKARLAALGEAVAKINHDLRNMLTSAQMASDRLAALGDPKVAQACRAWSGRWTAPSPWPATSWPMASPRSPSRWPAPTPCAPALDMAAEDAGLTPAASPWRPSSIRASRCWPTPTNCTAS
jgi:hypothetical protein